jgi:DNA helicase-2/ATP-dependent DNA helicase PcrA
VTDRRLEKPRLAPEDLGAAMRKAFAFGKGRELYRALSARLKALNAADFGDLLLEPIAILQDPIARSRGVPASLPLHAGRRISGHQCRAVSVAAAARGANKNLCVVGDDDQSILRLARGGGGEHLRFERDYPGAKVIRLERNYRSDAIDPRRGVPADRREPRAALGQDAVDRLDTDGDKVPGQGRVGRRRGKRATSRRTPKISTRKGHRFSRMAVLVRASFQNARIPKTRFVALGLP